MHKFQILVTALLLPCLLGCGVSNDEHQQAVQDLESTRKDLEEANKKIVELEAKIAELSETDQAYWNEILQLESSGQWPELIAKAEELLKRWPTSGHADAANGLIEKARNGVAEKLYSRAQEQLKSEEFEAARSSLLTIRDEYQDSPAYRRAVADLRSFDRLVEAAKIRAIGSGAWRSSTQTSPVDDSTNVYLSLSADSTITSRFGQAVRPELWLRCKENSTEVFVNWEVYLGIDTTRVLHRLDDRRAQTKTWNISTDHEATFYRDGHIGFIRQLLDHEKLLLQTTPYGESPVMAEFSLLGLVNVISPLREACGW